METRTKEVKLNVSKLHHFIDDKQVKEEKVQTTESIMRLINLICYSSRSMVGEIDFSSFTLQEAKLTLAELNCYYPDDLIGDPEDEIVNRDNLLTEVNRVAHFINITSDVSPNRKKTKLI